MRTEVVRFEIRRLLRAVPFRPFALSLENGDRIVIDPVGGVERLGFRSDLLYLGEMLDSAGVQFEKVAHGKYKSAIETFTEDSLTPPNREQFEAYLDVPYGEFLDATAAGNAPVQS